MERHLILTREEWAILKTEQHLRKMNPFSYWTNIAKLVATIDALHLYLDKTRHEHEALAEELGL